jgi:hypothetical protein
MQKIIYVLIGIAVIAGIWYWGRNNVQAPDTTEDYTSVITLAE